MLRQHMPSTWLETTVVLGHKLVVDENLQPVIVQMNLSVFTDKLGTNAITVLVDEHAKVPVDLALELLVGLGATAR
ncbi:MAG: hypothetical protein BWY17_00679 [Deltaproteobacteria bacterium ADurb.Bin207]|nr:MAG: hypothetical protein BWY17_00679 [Deltaproteobacteria bacterium ADurb.Bin207]